MVNKYKRFSAESYGVFLRTPEGKLIGAWPVELDGPGLEHIYYLADPEARTALGDEIERVVRNDLGG